MDRSHRQQLIQELETALNTKIFVYITGDRRGLETKIGSDVFPLFHKHLMQLGKQERIDLYLYSTGGITSAGFALVNLFREFCNNFNVIIPFKALSCATLISLGANKIIMTPMGQLSPIDPSVTHPLGPVPKFQSAAPRIAPVNVEDVNAYVDFAKKEVGLKEEDSMLKVFEILTSALDPLALGAIHRSREQIAFFATHLMQHHTTNESKINKVVKILTRERFSHDYIISRKEAIKTLKLPIVEPNDEILTLITNLLKEYNDLIKLDVPYNPETELAGSESVTQTFYRAIIETKNLTHAFITDKHIEKTMITQPGSIIPMTAYQETILKEEWVEVENI